MTICTICGGNGKPLRLSNLPETGCIDCVAKCNVCGSRILKDSAMVVNACVYVCKQCVDEYVSDYAKNS